MAAAVCVPMNFGRHHLNSPTHNNLTLNLEEGKKYRANSLILSFNSPVIERLVSTLEITSLDMDDFQETSVRCFVDCCYTGGVELLDRDCFRDVNKMAKVFQVDWLTGKCSNYFDDLLLKFLPHSWKSAESCSYGDTLYLFEEASYALLSLNQFQLINSIVNKMNPVYDSQDRIGTMRKFKNRFITEYLDDVTDLSTEKLDLIVKLAGRDLGIVVQSFVAKLRSHVSEQGAIMPETFRSFLDIADLRICRFYDKDVFEELFVAIENMNTSNNDLKWSFNLLKRSCEGNEEVPKLPFYYKTSYQSITFPGHLYKLSDLDKTFVDFILQLLVNNEIDNVLIFSEAVWRFAYSYGHEWGDNPEEDHTLQRLVKLVKKNREWRYVPPFAVNFYLPESHVRGGFSTLLKEFGFYRDGKPGVNNLANYTNRTLISCKEKYPETIELTLQQKVTGCKMKGRCGIMFRTDPNSGEKTFMDLLRGIQLITENTLYPEDLHFHSDVIKTDDIHFQVSDKDHIIYPVTPGLCSDSLKDILDSNDWEQIKFLNDACYLRVIYDLRVE